MLLDLFYQTTPIECKKRIHFHEFMKETHRIMHQFTLKHNTKTETPLTELANRIVETSWLLCLDEFQVLDIADAMILKGLFEELFKRGMVMVTTSNRNPEDLYKNGIHRSNFLPFIDFLYEKCQILNLNSGIDYRTLGENHQLHERYFYPLNDSTRQSIRQSFNKLTGNQASKI
jgi:protein AFG1